MTAKSNKFKVLLERGKKLLSNPKSILIKSLYQISSLMPDVLYLKLLFPLRTGYKLNLKNPRTFNEKLQWLKLYYRKPELSRLVDKFEVKNYVSEKIGEKYIIPTLGVWDSFDEINFDELPNQFVLKTTHDQGGVVICLDKNSFDFNLANKKLTSHLRITHTYSKSKEWVYKNVKPRIIAEQYMTDASSGELIDYKFFCFGGEVKALFVATDRQKKDEKVKFNFFNSDFKPIDLVQKHPENPSVISKPVTFEVMKEKASVLSENHPHLRVDFYEINGELYFGELTFFHHSGLEPFYPKKWDYVFGSYIDLNSIKE